MLFSVVIPTYNRLKFLPRALESVWAQRFADYELIVVDDGSTDGTAAYLESLGDRIRFFQQPNQGPGAARNLGASHARGEYLAFLDSDDLWFPWALATFAKVVQERSRPAILAASVVEFQAETELAQTSDEPVTVEAYGDYLASSHQRYSVGAGMSVLQRDAFLRSGGYVEQRINGEDHDLVLRLGTAPGFVQVLRPTTVAYRRHAASETASTERSVAGQLHLIRRERKGAFPGGALRARERRRILARHARPVTLACLRQGLVNDAWALFRATFGWNLSLGHIRYLTAFPLLATAARIRNASSCKPQAAVNAAQ